MHELSSGYTAEWCRNGCNLAVSKCEYKDGIGICKCPLTGYYYNYAARSCKKIDLCFNKTCEDDLICRSGKCQCPDNYKQNDTRCERK
ncbi:hypothetical protein AVEN_249038-1 [Araneus ventricosus]|uniref:Uncharacterized protein n=1 Tax=Araneus ventricosus TaxID=182803 RepID=A0A4Y2TE89_ARAVE|nr:hypothetical protein AVEN_249038-1 [Araneus ventricosus]